ncbi:hypothetical protein C0V97_14050 [Asaia sp. W19]|uniref:PIN domain-containing protein n=1 Tax=unclassified Asaia TaxID=2685023 RepID=UPI000F8D5DE7|nr:PIN domain-containing protein [Asaia sp. W19]RUT24847.1 hypothetical protein C0V97_14050 [Asaia sp. W19]
MPQYDAITFDTQTIERQAFNFDGPLLASFRQFHDGRIKVVISDVVAEEIKRHMIPVIADAKEKYINAVKKVQKFNLISSEASIPDLISLSPEQIAENRFFKFISDIDAEILPADPVSAAELYRRYTASLPPFSTNLKNKKHEFPDAIALLSLEKWAHQEGKRIIAVSGDKDWELFAEQSHLIDVVEDLSDGISKLLESTTGLKGLIKAYFREASEAYLAHGDQLILNFLNSSTDEITIEADGNSPYEFELTTYSVKFLSWEANVESPDGILILESKLDLVRVSVKFILEAEINGEFLLSVWDSIDHELIPLTGSEEQVTETLEATAIVDFEKEEDGSFFISNFELEPSSVWVDFGDIDPDASFYGDY